MQLIGLAVGIISGGFQFWLLTKFTRHVTGGTLTPAAALLGLLQFFLPIGVLLGVAFLRRQDLLLAGIGIAAALLAGTAVKYILTARKSGKRQG